VKVAEVK